MKKIGEILKKERENRGLSLHEIGMSLKINPKILKAIEEGDEKNLPAKTFLRGFIRSYAQYLRLDVDHILQMFQEEVGSTRPPEPRSEGESQSPLVPPQEPTQAAAPISPVAQEPKVAKSTQPEKPLRRPTDESLNPSSSNRMFTIIGAIVLVLLIAFVAKMVEKYQKEAAHPEEQTAVTTTTTPSVEAAATPHINESVPPESSAATTVSAAGTAAGLSAATTLPRSSEVMTAAPIKTTTTTVRPTTTTVRAVVAAPVSTTSTSTTMKPTTTTVKVTTTTVKPTATTTTSTTMPGKKTVEVIVEALNTVSIKYTLGDGPTETLDMTADQVHTFKGKGKISLEVSDGGAISVIVNGRDRGVPGTIGQPMKLSYP